MLSLFELGDLAFPFEYCLGIRVMNTVVHMSQAGTGCPDTSAAIPSQNVAPSLAALSTQRPFALFPILGNGWVLIMQAPDTAETTQKGCPSFRAPGSAKFSRLWHSPPSCLPVAFPFQGFGPKNAVWSCPFPSVRGWLIPSPSPEHSESFLLVSSIIHFSLLNGEAYPQSSECPPSTLLNFICHQGTRASEGAFLYGVQTSNALSK